VILEDVALCILTRGRAEKQIALKNLPLKLRKYIYLVVDEDEYRLHKQYITRCKKILKFPSGWGHFNGNFSDKKQWTADNINKKFCFFIDDDVTFSARHDGKLLKATKQDVYDAFNTMYHWMADDGFAHVGMSPRGGNNRVEEDSQEVTRAVTVCAFNLDIIRKEGLSLNRTLLMADFDATLNLLELGYPNKVTYKYAYGQVSNSEGGCSLYRTPETMKEASNILHGLHKNYVRVDIKKTTTPWHGFKTNQRTDVTISWKKAFKDGEARRRNKAGGFSKFLK